MTVIAAKKEKDHISISCDSQISWGNHGKTKMTDALYMQPSKVFQVNGLTVGASGWLEESSMFEIFCKTRKPKSASEDGILEFLSDFYDWGKKKNGDFKLRNYSIIIFKGKIFETFEWGIKEVGEYCATGSGMLLALSAMYFGKNTVKAVEAAKHFDLGCGGEIRTIKIPT